MRFTRPLLLLASAVAVSCSPIVERSVSIVSKPTLSKEDGTTWLRASQGNTEMSEIWAWGQERPPVKLETRKTYRFDLIEDRVLSEVPSGNDRYHWSSDLIRITYNGQVIYDQTVCDLHHTRMERRTVPIAYGLPMISPAEMKARQNIFPNAISSVLGGCCVMKQKDTRVFQCDACLAAKKEWKAAHGGD